MGEVNKVWSNEVVSAIYNLLVYIMADSVLVISDSRLDSKLKDLDRKYSLLSRRLPSDKEYKH